jgi:hypothetical protein
MVGKLHIYKRYFGTEIMLICLASLPFAAVCIAALIVERGIRLGISIAIASSALTIGALCLHAVVVEPSCRINESECLGATATAWLIAFPWIAPSIGFVLRLAGKIRRDAGGF